MVNGCFSNRKRIIFSAGILACLIILFSCKKSEDDSIPVRKLGDYYSLEWITYFESNEYISKLPIVEIDHLNRIFLCYTADGWMKALTIDSIGNSSELAISGNYAEYFQDAFFSQHNIPYFCTNERIIQYADSGCISYYPVDSGTHLIMASMNPADGSLWVATRYGLYSSEDGTDFTLVKSHEELLGESYHMYPADQSWDRIKKMIWLNNTLYYLIMGELWTYHEGTWLKLNDALAYADIYFSDFCIDSHDIVWVTVIGYSGLLKLDGENEEYLPFPSMYNPSGGNISDPAVNSAFDLSVTVTNLEIDHSDHIWMTLSSGGLIMFSENSWYTLSSGLEGVNILSLSNPLFMTIDNKDNVIFGHTAYLSVGRISKK
jgi:hypothetical protein